MFADHTCKGFDINNFWNLNWLKSKKLPPEAEAYLQYLETGKDQIISEQFSGIDAI